MFMMLMIISKCSLGNSIASLPPFGLKFALQEQRLLRTY